MLQSQAYIYIYTHIEESFVSERGSEEREREKERGKERAIFL